MKNLTSITENISFLKHQISKEVEKIDKCGGNNTYHTTDSIVYVGNWQDAIPRQIWSDPTLNAIDVRSWGIIRTQAIQGSTVILSLNSVLRESLGYSKATLSRALYILRLTRWISLCSILRTETGQFKGNIYAIHDYPINLNDAVYMDNEYISFVNKQTSHKNSSIKKLASIIWNEIDRMDRGNFNETEPSEYITVAIQDSIASKDCFIKTLNQTKNNVSRINGPEERQVQKINLGKKHQVQKIYPVKIKTEKNNNPVDYQQDNIQVQKMNLDVICSSCSSFNNKKTTTTGKGIKKVGSNFEPDQNILDPPCPDLFGDLVFPDSFSSDEITLGRKCLEIIDPNLHQDLLDEVAAQIRLKSKTSNPVRNQVGYLSWICNEYQKGSVRLTSAYLNHRKKRENKKLRERKNIENQEKLTKAALAGSFGEVVFSEAYHNSGGESTNNETLKNQLSSLKQKLGGVPNEQ